MISIIKPINPRIHCVGDGRGLRDVFMNDNKINNVVYANELKGIIEFVPHPLKAKRNGEIYTRKLRGVVTVEFQQSNGVHHGAS